MPSSSRTIKITRWVARGLSAFILLFVILVVVVEVFYTEIIYQVPEVWPPFSSHMIFFLILKALPIVGLALAFRWEAVGGCIALGTFIVYGALDPSVFAHMFIVPLAAILFLICAWVDDRRRFLRTGGSLSAETC